jgi:Gpi18-like mannosyltransferase
MKILAWVGIVLIVIISGFIAALVDNIYGNIGYTCYVVVSSMLISAMCIRFGIF